MIKKLSVLSLLLSLGFYLHAQDRETLSLTAAYSLLEENYPSLEQSKILDEIYQKELDQLDIVLKPSLFLKADARLQSHSVKLDAGDTMTPFEIDQSIVSVKSYAEANYTILDGGVNDALRKKKSAQLVADQQTIEIQRFELRGRINQLFITITLLREQSKLFDISKKDIESRIEQVEAAVEYGVALESDLTQLLVKELELSAQKENMNLQIAGLINSLEDLTETSLSNSVLLTFPKLGSAEEIPEINRPEQKLFKVQKEAILANSDLLAAERKGKLFAYAQAGIGYPNPLNFLDNNIAPYGLIGAQFSWKITDWKKGQLDREMLSLNVAKIEKAEDTFEFNLESREANYLAQINRLNNQIAYDQKIVDLQKSILQQYAVQLEEGVITAADYVNQVDAELLAIQTLEIHRTELLKTQLNFWNERGAF